MKYKYESLDLNAAYLFNRGENVEAYRLLGCHKRENGYSFTCWAPNAEAVEIVGDFNNWQSGDYFLKHHPEQGMFQITLEEIEAFENYKYLIHTKDGRQILKADPYGMHAETRPGTASKVYSLDELQEPKPFTLNPNPLNIYEVNLLSWRQYEDGEPFSYRKLAEELVDYVVEMGYNCIELMPIMEHPFDGSWGYQITGYYAPTSRYGTPADFQYFVDSCHRAGIGVILDWVPSHFCKDEQGLRYFDGTATYEDPIEEKAYNRVWDTMAFNFHSPQVRSFLYSNANYWNKIYGIDGLRVDAVAYMLYEGFGERDVDVENPDSYRQESIYFLQQLNDRIHRSNEDFLMIAEESSSFPRVTHSTEDGGLGFDFKWNMGWRHDILEYMEMDPVYRPYHHSALTFPIVYTYNERYILPFSHDEVVHGKRSLFSKQYGFYQDRFDQLRLLMLYMMAQPGGVLNFMGNEFAQVIEWDEYKELDWLLLKYPKHDEHRKYMKQLNRLYLDTPALWVWDHKMEGFQWVDVDNSQESIIAFFRHGPKDSVLVVLNFTPMERKRYPLYIPKGKYRKLFGTHRGEKKFVTKNINETTAIEVDLAPYEGMYIVDETMETK